MNALSLQNVVSKAEQNLQYTAQKLQQGNQKDSTIEAEFKALKKITKKQIIPLGIPSSNESFHTYYHTLKDTISSKVQAIIEQVPITPIIKKQIERESVIALREVLSRYYLRPHQQEALLHIRHHAQKHKNILVQMPTGTGKTVLFSFIPDILESKKKVLILSHRDTLFHQTQKKVQDINPEKNVQIEANKHHHTQECDILVGSVGTLGRKAIKNTNEQLDHELEEAFDANPNITYIRNPEEYCERLKNLNPHDFDTIVIDEAHHSTASSYRRIIDYFKQENPNITLIGVTATPIRADDEKLEDIYSVLAYSMTLREAIEKKILSEINCYRINTNVSLDKLDIGHGDFDKTQLSRTINTPRRNALVIEKLNTYGIHPDGRKMKSMLFAGSVEHSKELTRMAIDSGWRGVHIDADTPASERDDALQKLRNGEYDFISNCEVFTEGTDIEELELVAMARPTKSAILYEQMIGRGTRFIAGKKEQMVLLDFVDATKYHKVMDCSKIFGQERPLPNGFITKKLREREEEEIKYPKTHKETSTIKEDDQQYSLFKSIPEISTSPINFIGDHGYARVYVSQGRYIEIAQTPVMNAWKCYLGQVRKDLGIPSYDDGERLFSTISEAITYIEHLLKTFFSKDKSIWNKHANSILQREAPTEKQLRVLAKYFNDRNMIQQFGVQFPHLQQQLPSFKKAVKGYTKNISNEKEIKKGTNGKIRTLSVFNKTFQDQLIDSGLTKDVASNLIGFVKNKKEEFYDDPYGIKTNDTCNEAERELIYHYLFSHQVGLQLYKKTYPSSEKMPYTIEDITTQNGDLLQLMVKELQAHQCANDKHYQNLQQYVELGFKANILSKNEYDTFYKQLGDYPPLNEQYIEECIAYISSKLREQEEEKKKNTVSTPVAKTTISPNAPVFENDEKEKKHLIYQLGDYSRSLKIYQEFWPDKATEKGIGSDYETLTIDTLKELITEITKAQLATNSNYKHLIDVTTKAEELMDQQGDLTYKHLTESIWEACSGYIVSSEKRKKQLLTTTRARELNVQVQKVIELLSQNVSHPFTSEPQKELTKEFKNYTYSVIKIAQEHHVLSDTEAREYGKIIYNDTSTYTQVKNIFSMVNDVLKARGIRYKKRKS